jgi:non-specific serine/threonine protein kinase
MVEACAQLIDGALRACPQLKILASSREALGIRGETIYRVPSLSLPDQAEATWESLLRSESAQLFVERAEAVDPRFRLTDAVAPSIAQICSRLEVSVGDQLAAARWRSFPRNRSPGGWMTVRLLTGDRTTAPANAAGADRLTDLSEEERCCSGSSRVREAGASGRRRSATWTCST